VQEWPPPLAQQPRAHDSSSTGQDDLAPPSLSLSLSPDCLSIASTYDFDSSSLFAATNNFDFSFDCFDTAAILPTTTATSDSGIDVTSWPEFQFDPTQLTQVPTITTTNPMYDTHLPDLTFSHHHFSNAANSPSSLFDTTTTTHPPSTGSGSPSSSSPEQDQHLHFLDPPPVHPGLSLPKTHKQQGEKPKRGRPPSSTRSASPNDYDIIVKRQRNNVAAKKYRQKKIDRIQELEEEVDEVRKERDELRIRLARQEAETKALREMLRMGVKVGEGGGQ
jgi:hypothetical protein